MIALHCIGLLKMDTLKFAVFCCSAMLMWRQRPGSNYPRPYFYYWFYDAKLCLRKLILLLFFSQQTPLHFSVREDHVEICRLLVEWKADVAARDRCFGPPPSLHLSLTICLAGVVKLHFTTPSTGAKPWLHTCAASARRNDALLRLDPPK